MDGIEPRRQFTIGELAKEFSVTFRALRFYEAKGLLNPTRRGKNRSYSRRDRARLKLVLIGKRADFTLGEIREMLDLYDLDDGGTRQRQVAVVKLREQTEFLEQQIKDKSDAIKELHELREMLEQIDRVDSQIARRQ